MSNTLSRLAGNIANSLQQAWNAADAQAFADLFAEDADFIHILGGHGRGRHAIAAAHRALFSGIYRASRVSFDIEDIRPIGTDSFVVFLLQKLRFVAASGIQEMICRPSLIVRRQNESWSIVLLQNTRVADAAPADLVDHPFAPEPSLDAMP